MGDNAPDRDCSDSHVAEVTCMASAVLDGMGVGMLMGR